MSKNQTNLYEFWSKSEASVSQRASSSASSILVEQQHDPSPLSPIVIEQRLDSSSPSTLVEQQRCSLSLTTSPGDSENEMVVGNKNAPGRFSLSPRVLSQICSYSCQIKK